MFFVVVGCIKTHVGDNPSEISSLPMRLIYMEAGISISLIFQGIYQLHVNTCIHSVNKKEN